jgi:hypothetical protein
MKALIMIIIGISFPLQLLGQNDIVLIWDKDASAISNAQNLLSIHKILYQFQNEHIQLKYWDERNFKGKSLGIGYRFAKTILLDYQIDYLAHLYQHEVFGHGYRFRAFGYTGNSYNINLIPPYGKGGGFARSGTLDAGREIGEHESIMISSGGMEASAILSRTLRKRWLIRGEINYRESLPFLSGFTVKSVLKPGDILRGKDWIRG